MHGCTLPVIDACAGCGGGIRMVMHIFAEMRAQLGVVVYVEHLCSIERDPVARAFLKAAGHVGKPLFGNLTDVLEPLAYDYMTEAMVAPPRSGPPGRRSSLRWLTTTPGRQRKGTANASASLLPWTTAGRTWRAGGAVSGDRPVIAAQTKPVTFAAPVAGARTVFKLARCGGGPCSATIATPGTLLIRQCRRRLHRHPSRASPLCRRENVATCVSRGVPLRSKGAGRQSRSCSLQRVGHLLQRASISCAARMRCWIRPSWFSRKRVG